MAGRRRDEVLDEAILRAASAVLSDGGYAAFAIETIARRLEIPRSTIYTRWRCRSDLVAHVLSRRMALMREIEPDAFGDLRSALIEYVAEDLDLSRSREGLAIAQAVLEAHDSGRTDVDEVVQARDRRRAGYRLLLERAVEQGDLPGDADLDLLLDLLLGAVWAAALRTPARAETDAPRLVDAVLTATGRQTT